MVATEMDPYTHCAAIIIITSDDPQAHQLSTIVTNSLLVLDMLSSGDFSTKKIARIASNVLRYVLLHRSIGFHYLTFLLLFRGRATDLAAADFKKSKGSASKQCNEDQGHPQDPKHMEGHYSASGEQNWNGKSKHAPLPIAKPPANSAKPSYQSLPENALQGEMLDPDTMMREQFCQVITYQFLLQAVEANANIDE